ncbi:hypothetical protein H0H87_000912 [Tephrocybe sp. NHM501043]|nr:hypothetical protein H0H87_000912 [Tephrocybe sp. NHM501043]
MTYFEFTRRALSSSTSAIRAPLCTLLLVTLKALLSWLPLESSRSSTRSPHVHESVKPLLRVSPILDIIWVCLRLSRESHWVHPQNGEMYTTILEFLERLKEVGKGALKELVCGTRQPIGQTRGVGAMVWGWADGYKAEDKERQEQPKKGVKTKGVGWIAGPVQKSFSDFLKAGAALNDVRTMRDKVSEDEGEKRELLDKLFRELYRWQLNSWLM